MLPGGAGATLLYRPWWWLRFNGGLAYDVVGFGYRGGVSLAPGHGVVTPTLNFDAGPGRLAGRRRGALATIEAYALPGEALAPSGWVQNGGNPGQGLRPLTP